jgi:hypothetical protein
VAMLLTLFGFLPIFLSWNLNTTWNLQRVFIFSGNVNSSLHWYGLPLGSNWVTSYALTLAIFAIGSIWIWRALDRRFHRPTATLLSKGQSYGLVASFQGLLLGFFIGDRALAWDRMVLFSLIMLIIFFGVIVVLAPSRQTVLDWARYRHHRPAKDRRPLLHDLLWDEGSPMVGAIALNLLMTAALMVGWVLLLPEQFGKVHLMLNLLLGLSAIALYAIVTQLILLSKSPQRSGLALLSVMFLLLTPLIMAAIELSNLHPVAARIWMMFTPVPMLGSTYFAPLSTLMLALLGQWSASILLSIGLALKVRQMGSTSTKSLFGSAS